MSYLSRLRSSATVPAITSLQAVLLVLALPPAHAARAQTGRPAMKCPVITVECPVSCAGPGETFMFRAVVDFGLATPAAVRWEVSGGRLLAGQGTDSITVEPGCDSVTATAELVGAPAGCAVSASCTSMTDCCMRPTALRHAEFGVIDKREEEARLATFAVDLQGQPPGTTGHVIVTGAGRDRRAARIRRHLVAVEGIGADRLKVSKRKGRQQKVVLYIVPPGADSPVDDDLGP